MLTRTYTQTFNEVRFADPYKACTRCSGWIDGYLDTAQGLPPLVPCEHAAPYYDVCPSWSPVDGCGCAEWNARNPDEPPIEHARRTPEPGDDRRY
jgi:hypothetical protein